MGREKKSHSRGDPPRRSHHGRERGSFGDAGAAGTTPTQKANFKKAVDAFNNMATIDKATSPLWNLLDPNVTIFDITFDHEKLKGDPNDPVNPLRPVIDGLYQLVVSHGGPPVGPFFDPWHYGEPNYKASNKVSGKAYWIDNDGTGSEPIRYTFIFKGNLLVALHGR